MAFDAGMLACVLHELNQNATGARVEKVCQPGRDEILLQIRCLTGGQRILINAGANHPRIGFTAANPENPAQPPMFCMLLRKHLSGAKLVSATQEGFERVATLTFETRDEMGFPCVRYLIAEIMGKYSNLIFADENKKILAVLRPVDFTTSSLRQVLPGMRYELPPAQQKADPLQADEASFRAAFDAADPDRSADKLLTGTYLGLSAAVAREVVFRATRHTDTPLRYCHADTLWAAFNDLRKVILENRYAPCLVKVNGAPVEYCFYPLQQYGPDAEVIPFASAGALLDAYFVNRDREQRIRQRASDLLRLLTNAENRLQKKLELQRAELRDCAKGEEYKKQGDLIVGNLHLLERGMTRVTLTDYEDWHEDGSYGECTVTLDERLSPSQNAQRLYKKYAKSRTAKVELTRLIAEGEAEQVYLETVFDALTRAETNADLTEIREELYHGGYASRLAGYVAAKKVPAPSVMQFRTEGGFRVLCGKNNYQNDYISHKLADKRDYWFHAKNYPGSHVVLITDGKEPGDADYTQAAEIAAFYSKAEGQNVAVDYTTVRQLKRPPGSRPGFVIYHQNWTAYVTPDADRIAKLRVNGGK